MKHDRRERHFAGLKAHPGPDRKRFKGGGSTTSTQTASSEPWEVQQPFLTQGFEEAKSQLEGPNPSFFPGGTVIPFSPATEAAQGLRTTSALNPNSLINVAGTEASRTIGGEYLQPNNPVFRGLLEGITGQVRQGVDTQFNRAGRFGSPGHSEATARGITTGMLPFINSERNRMSNAVNQAGAVSQFAPSELERVGRAREGLGRDVLQEDLDRFNFGQNVDQLKLQQFMANIMGSFGGQSTSTVTQPTFSNPLMQGLGTAASVASIVGKCWVAREVYGLENPKWLRFRSWMLDRAPSWFRWFYIRYGSGFAGWLHSHPRWKAPIRRWMDSKLKEA